MNNLLKKYFLILIFITINIFPKCNCSCCCKKKPEILNNNNFYLQEKQQKEEKERIERQQKLEKERKNKEEEQKRLKEEEEEQKKLKEAEEKRRKLDEQKRLKEEDEQKRLKEEDEQKRLKEEDEQKRLKEEEEEQKKLKEEDDEQKRLKEEDEQKRLKEEESKKEEEENKSYLEILSEDITNFKILKDDFFTEKKDIYTGCGNLGEGSFGSVYKIQKKNNENFFALKQIVVKDFNKDLNEVKCIQKEIQNMILLRNEKNIVKIFDVYKLESSSDNIYYIIMEFCENGDLNKAIENKNFGKGKDKLAYQIINAVHSCYNEKIVHRDLKPKNIFLDKDWNVKLGDFGLSDIFEYDEKDGKDGLRVGSIRYMCYEKNRRLKHNPFKADLYSLGVILYQLYTELAYSKDERKIYIHKNGEKVVDGYEDYVYTNENVECKLNKNLADEKYNNLKILLTGLLQQYEKNRWGWQDIFDSEFYKKLNEKYKE